MMRGARRYAAAPGKYRIFIVDEVHMLSGPAFNALLFGVTPLGRALGWKPKPLRASALPPNAPRMMDLLMRVHGTQLLVDGCFNADTHAGNFLLMPDDRIALIDYGSTKRLQRSERRDVCGQVLLARRCGGVY